MATHRSFRLTSNTPTAGQTASRRSLLHTAIIQAAIFLVTSIILDGMKLFRICFTAAVAYWVAVAIIFLRRNRKLRRGDGQFIRFGYFITLVLSLFLGAIIPAVCDKPDCVVGEFLWLGHAAADKMIAMASLLATKPPQTDPGFGQWGSLDTRRV